MAADDPLGEIMARAFFEREQPPPPQFAQPPQQPDWMRFMPNVALDTRDYRAPYLGGGASAPFAGGTVGVEGGYQPRPNMPPEFDARLRYRRQF